MMRPYSVAVRCFAPRVAAWQGIVVYARELPMCRMIAAPASNEELHIVIEPTHGNLVRACQGAWQSVRSAMKESHPKLETAMLVDQVTGRELFVGNDGLGAQVRTREVASLILVGLVTVAWLLAGSATFARDLGTEWIAGGMTGIVGALVAAVWALVDWRRGRLKWKDQR